MSTRARATLMRAIRHGQQRTQLARILQWLYGAGEQGIAVPDLTPGNGFLFQDSAGTTPVTAYEQPVGLILDRSKGLVLGPNLVTTYASGGAYGNYNGMSLAGTVLTASDAPANGYFARFPVTAGRSYLISLPTPLSVSGGTWQIQVAWSANGTSLGGIVANFPISSTSCRFAAPATAVSCEVIIQRAAASSGGATDTCTGFVGFTVRELPGNHIVQATSTKRPTLSARYNLLTRSEEFANGVWVKGNVSGDITLTTGQQDPLGGTTATSFQLNVASANFIYQNVGTLGGAVYTASCYLKQGTARYGYIILVIGANRYAVLIDLQTGSFISEHNTLTPLSSKSYSISPAGNGYWRLSVSGANTGGGGGYIVVEQSTTSAITVDQYIDITNSGTGQTILIWGADLRRTIDTIGQPAYQRVGASNDYDTAGFYPYLAFDGTDDSMATAASVDFTTVTSDGQARRNLLLNPTQFGVVATWPLDNATIAANVVATTDPFGGNTADKLQETTATGRHSVAQDVTVSSSTTYTFSYYAKAAERSKTEFFLAGGGTNTGIAGAFDLTGSGAVFPTTISGITNGICSIQDVGNGWYRCVTTFTTATISSPQIRIHTNNGTTANSYAGTTGRGIYIYGAQLETGSSATAFQNIGTNKMTVFAGVTKLSDVAESIITELSSVAIVDGSFVLNSPFNASNSAARFLSRGTSAAQAVSGALPAPVSFVATGNADIAGDVVTLRLNGIQAATSSADQGTGNFGNYTLFLGARNNASNFFNGRLYPFFIRGAATDAGTIAQVEQYIKARIPVNF